MTIEEIQVREITTVIFYKESKENNGAIVAVFPYEHERIGIISCYSHVGQHSGASVEYCNTLKKAKKKEYASLKAELESKPYNYKLKII